ncbi:MAG: SpoIIE family protein phosphatase [Roseiflexaceae bacterium]|nr:SpoIIE family protein phosphatase [Roseiflexaceae bacterium]
MTTVIQRFRRAFGRAAPQAPVAPERARAAASADAVRNLDLTPSDPLLGYLQRTPGVIDFQNLRLASPMVERLRAEGVRLAVPLLSQGALIGLLTLGPRRSEQDYTSDDHTLLGNLASQAAPALRVAQLVRQQQLEARERERIAQELRVARLIQQTLLPRSVPDVAGWGITPYYEPAREVGGDFYDFIELGDGQLGLVIADVTDKGVPAALVMAMARSILRAAAGRLDSPGAVLERTNEVLYPDMPPNMFVTCLYAILDTHSGRLRFANAGHDLPYWHHAGGVSELYARGMPLGLMPGMDYEESEIVLAPGDHVLFYSDGLVEAHNAEREMFSFDRLEALVGAHADGGQPLVDMLLGELASFTGSGWVQEDDITLVALGREAASGNEPRSYPATQTVDEHSSDTWQTLAELEIPSLPDNERLAMEQVGAIACDLGLAPLRLERLKTAVAETTMNAMEHGNGYRADQPVRISVRRSETALAVRVYDYGAGGEIAADEPDLDAKLAGLQTARGWGLHLVRHMVDEVQMGSEDGMHMVELIIQL